MPTWSELREHASTKYTLHRLEDTWFSLVWQTAEDRTQLITVIRYEAFEQEWIEFRSFVCKADEMSPRVALKKNAEFALGALAVDDDGDYLLIHRAPLATLDPEEFALPLQVLSSGADALEKQHSAGDQF